jgi:hypothetical protein
MTDSYLEPTEAELDAQIVGFLRHHIVKVIKAPIVASMAAFSVFMLNGSLLKAATVAIVCLLLSAFNTWRRFLEPLVFWCFALAVVQWCDADILVRLKSFFP